MKTQTVIPAFLLIAFTLLFQSCAPPKESVKIQPKKVTAAEKAAGFSSAFKKREMPFKIPRGSFVESVKIDTADKSIEIDLSRSFSFAAFRGDYVKSIYLSVKNFFGADFSNYKFSVRSLGHPIEDFIPNYFRGSKADYDNSRIPVRTAALSAPVVRDESKKFIPVDGLYRRNIAIAPSHGWYYNYSTDRWEWQRPRMFQSVEDLLPNSFCIPFLIPMLENAGAVVFDPRERDIQTNEVVVDNDSRSDVKKKYYFELSTDGTHSWTDGGTGFAAGNLPYASDLNPFTTGTYRVAKSDSIASASVSWIPDIPEAGYYAVYISYDASLNNVDDAEYSVYHSGIRTDFKVNQRVVGSTWQYLGKFKFSAGYHPDSNKVVLTNRSAELGKYISADAVRFGGGMGIIKRGGRTSGRPKFVEGSRYYLQYAGIPDSLYDFNKNKDDYNDDKQDRSKYVNYLNGGSLNDPGVKGLGIPIDLSIAFHTDAGVTSNDTTIGTLALYGIKGEDSKDRFPNGVSRLASRDLADVLQTQITDDIRAQYDPAWNRRQIMDEQPSNDAYPQQYSEVYRPNVPAVLIELLSHQNFLDMQFALDPGFRFTVARAMYKGILKFLSVQYGFNYVVQPLPVKNFSSSFTSNGNVKLSWEPVVDSLEQTARPDGYIVYTRINGGDFNNGIRVENSSALIKHIKQGEIYSFKVTAYNKGGESFPSEILSVCRQKKDTKTALIINGFDRVSEPAYVYGKKYAGFLNGIDPGVPYKYDISFTGRQNNFKPYEPWKSNDEPGWGASNADYEGKVIAGNTFDYPYLHGLSLKKCGYSFVSTGAGALENGTIDLNEYKFVDLILGQQKTAHWQRAAEDSAYGLKFKAFPKTLQSKITAYCEKGGNIFITGSYPGTDLFSKNTADSADAAFGWDILKFRWVTGGASKTGKVFAADSAFSPDLKSFRFNTELNKSIYAASFPDAVAPAKGGKILLRYSDDEFSAGVAYKNNYGVVVFGFPFETIKNQGDRDEIMKAVINYLRP